MKTPKFNFVPERQLGEPVNGNGCWTVSVLASKATTSIYFPSDMVHALDMDGKYIQLFADIEKKAIGWREIKGNTDLDIVGGARKATKNQKNGCCAVWYRQVGQVFRL